MMYAYFRERYPLIIEQVPINAIQPFDIVYLHLNDLIERCADLHFAEGQYTNSDKFWISLLHHVDHLINLLHPQKELYFILDGSIPRALVPNGRVRLFLRQQRRSKKKNDEYVQRSKHKKKNNHGAYPLHDQNHEKPSGSPPFDFFNLIAGTSFMQDVQYCLLYYIGMKLHSQESWKHLDVVFSGVGTTGEGHHKILDYIRRSAAKRQGSTEPRICICGSFTHCFITALASHISNLFLLRADFGMDPTSFSTGVNRHIIGAPLLCSLVHINLLRECLVFDLMTLRQSLASSGTEAEDPLLRTPSKKTDREGVAAKILYKPCRDSSCSPPSELCEETNGTVFDLPHDFPPSSHITHCIINDFLFLAIMCNHNISLRLPYKDVPETEFEQVLDLYRTYRQTSFSKPRWLTAADGTVNWENVLQFLHLIPLGNDQRSSEGDAHRTTPQGSRDIEEGTSNWTSVNTEEGSSIYKQTCDAVPGFIDATALPVFNNSEFPFTKFKDSSENETAYYKWYFGWDITTSGGKNQLRRLVTCYTKAIQWTLHYFLSGVTSWSWSYPFRYPPLLRSFIKYFSHSSLLSTSEKISSRPLSCASQLVCFLPPMSLKLLAPSLYNYVSQRFPSLCFPSIPLVSTLQNDDFTAVYIRPIAQLYELDLQLNANAHPSSPSSSPLDEFEHSDLLLFSDNDATLALRSHFPHMFKTIDPCRVTVSLLESVDQLRQKQTPLTENVLYTFPVPSLMEMNVTQAKIINRSLNNSTTPGVSVKPRLIVEVEPPSIGSDSREALEDYLYSLLRSLLKDDVLYMDYPHNRLGKPIALCGKTWCFRSTNLCFNMNDALDVLDISRLYTAPLSMKKKSGSSKSPFLYECDPPSSTFFVEEVQRQESRLEAMGLRVDYANFPIDSTVVKNVLMRASEYNFKKTNEDRHYQPYAIGQILVEMLPVTDIMPSYPTIRYTCQPKSFYRSLYLLFKKSHFHWNIKAQLRPRLVPGTTVICVNRSNPLFGHMGTMKFVGPTPGTTESIFELYQETYDESWTLQKEFYEIAMNDLKGTEWYYIEEVAKLLNASWYVVQALSQSLYVEVGADAPVDIGLNLACVKENQRFCAPSYTSFIPDYSSKHSPTKMKLLFSLLAVNLLRSFAEAWPSIISSLEFLGKSLNTISSSVTHPIKSYSLFYTENPSDWATRILEWRLQQNITHMIKAGPYTQALSPAGRQRVEKQQNKWVSQRKLRHTIRVTGLNEVYPAHLTGYLPDILLAASPHKYIQTRDFSYLGGIQLGQRVVYVRWDGQLPFGTAGCATATTLDPDGFEQWVELITERPCIGCSDLQGRCSANRGVLVPASSLMCLVPEVLPHGLSISSISEYQSFIQEPIRRLQRESSSPNREAESRYSPSTCYFSFGESPSENEKYTSLDTKAYVTQGSDSETNKEADMADLDHDTEGTTSARASCATSSVQATKTVQTLNTIEQLLRFKSQLHLLGNVEDSQVSAEPRPNMSSPVMVVSPENDHTKHPTVKEMNASSLRSSYRHMSSRYLSPNVPQEDTQQDIRLLLNALRGSVHGNVKIQSQSMTNMKYPPMGLLTFDSEGKSLYNHTASTHQIAGALAQAVPSLRSQRTASGSNAVGHELLDILQYGHTAFRSTKQYINDQDICGKTNGQLMPRSTSNYRFHNQVTAHHDERHNVSPRHKGKPRKLSERRTGKKSFHGDTMNTAMYTPYHTTPRSYTRFSEHGEIVDPVPPACIPVFQPRRSS